MPNHIYKLNKALYSLRQAPRAWYDRQSKFLLENDFIRENVDKTLFIKKKNNKLLVVQIYIDDIIFGETNEILCKEFTKLMQREFEMSLVGSGTFDSRHRRTIPNEQSHATTNTVSLQPSGYY